MRRAVPAAVAACILALPTVLAFYTGGYPTEPRLIAGLVVWALVLLVAVAGPSPLPRSTPARVALGGLAALTAWTALSLTWAPLGGPAAESVQRLLLYLGVLVLAVAVLTAPRALRAVEPALAAGATVVIGYGMAGRLLPGVLELARSASAGGRLEQPITYWNGEGVHAAVGLILCARLAGDPDRSPATRAAAAAALPLLGAGLYVTYSRGALAVVVLGLALLVAVVPGRRQLRAVALAIATGAVAAAATATLPGVSALEGTRDEQIRDGLVALAVLLVLAAVSTLAERRLGRAPDAPLPAAWARRLPRVAAALGAAILAGLVIGGLGERPSERELAAGATAGRLATVSSNRYEYWRVGLGAFAREPLTGLGAGGFRVEWLRERPIAEAARDAHSLEVEMLTELGLPGLLALLALAGAVAVAGRRAARTRPELAAGSCAALAAWFVHASIDWDWQLPAVTLPAVVLAGVLLALGEISPRAPVPGPGGAARPAPA